MLLIMYLFTMYCSGCRTCIGIPIFTSNTEICCENAEAIAIEAYPQCALLSQCQRLSHCDVTSPPSARVIVATTSISAFSSNMLSMAAAH